MRILFCFIFLAFYSMAYSQTNTGPKKGAIISFSESSFDFGDIKQGQKVEHIFKYKNIGTEPLIVSEVLTTCGCTAPNWSKTPLAPNKEAELKITFNSEGKMGRQHKVITILSNATATAINLNIMSNVLPNDNQ